MNAYLHLGGGSGGGYMSFVIATEASTVKDRALRMERFFEKHLRLTGVASA
jgi:hypothetical protein